MEIIIISNQQKTFSGVRTLIKGANNGGLSSRETFLQMNETRS